MPDYVEIETKREQQANRFAINLLLPKKLVKQILDQQIEKLNYDKHDINPRQYDKLLITSAQILQVTVPLLRARILELNLFTRKER